MTRIHATRGAARRLAIATCAHGRVIAGGLALAATAQAIACVERQAPTSAPVEDARHAITLALADLDRVATGDHRRGSDLAHPCDDPTELFVQIDDAFAGEVRLRAQADTGEMDILFLSGTTISDLVRAVNAFTSSTNVVAEQSSINPYRVRLTTVVVDEPGESTIWARATGYGSPRRIFREAVGGVGDYEALDTGHRGRDGDANCDHEVNVQDLLFVIHEWGVCGACGGDVTRDGVVDVSDMLAVLEYWD